MSSSISSSSKSPSPVRTIASPRMLRGLALFKCLEGSGGQDNQASPNASYTPSDQGDEENERSKEVIECFEPSFAISEPKK